MTERRTGEDEFDQTGQDQEQLRSHGQPMDEGEFDRVKGDRGDAGRGQPMDEPEFDRVKGDRGDAGRGQPMDEPEFD